LVFACVLSVACSSGSEDKAPDYRVQSIGCLLPIPGSYVLNTNSDSGYFFYDSSEGSFGQIRIDKYDEAEFKDMLLQSVIVEKIETTDRVAMSVLWKLEGPSAPDLPVALFHDDVEVVTIIGDEATNWKSRFASCLETPKPQRPDDFGQILSR
ncbi:MAG: hypothetical protein MJA32_08180, partial [Proteobacteria bacterium]|nr:hypothetical protein [Pseudomonadota bacterium]